MKKIAIVFVMFSIFSCTEKIEKPKKFLEKEEMTNLLYELALLSSSRSYAYKDTLLSEFSPLNILVKYDLDSLSFIENNNYYIKQPKLYAEMYDSINVRLQRKIKEFEALPNDPRDSTALLFNEKINKIRLNFE